MIGNFVCAAPAVVFPGGTGGTGGTPLDSAWPCGTGRWDRWNRRRPGSCCRAKIFLRGSTGPTDRSHQNRQNCLQYHRFHLVTPERDGSLARMKMSLSSN